MFSLCFSICNILNVHISSPWRYSAITWPAEMTCCPWSFLFDFYLTVSKTYGNVKLASSKRQTFVLDDIWFQYIHKRNLGTTYGLINLYKCVLSILWHNTSARTGDRKLLTKKQMLCLIVIQECSGTINMACRKKLNCLF